jgi:hypothetical protein
MEITGIWDLRSRRWAWCKRYMQQIQESMGTPFMYVETTYTYKLLQNDLDFRDAQRASAKALVADWKGAMKRRKSPLADESDELLLDLAVAMQELTGRSRHQEQIAQTIRVVHALLPPEPALAIEASA